MQTKTLRYNSAPRLSLLGMAEHWLDTKLDAAFTAATTTVTASSNVLAFAVEPAGAATNVVTINGLPVSCHAEGASLLVFGRPNSDSPFSWVSEPPCCGVPGKNGARLRKVHGLQGPMDDAFMAPFLVVGPQPSTASSSSSAPMIDSWITAELEHLLERWAGVFRGTPRFKLADDVTEQDMREFNLVLWGTPETSPLVASVMATLEQLGVATWNAAGGHTSRLSIGSRKFCGDEQTAPAQVLQLIYPSPFAAGKYVLLNSGTTFREAHDGTNSMQNPKLPDWAVIDVAKAPPTATTPGHVVAAGFMDERWRP